MHQRPISSLIENYGFFDAMLGIRNDPSLFSDIATNLLEDIEKRAKLAQANGFRSMAITDDIAGNKGLLFSYDYFWDTVYPVYKEISKVIKGNDLFTNLVSGMTNFLFLAPFRFSKIAHSTADINYLCLTPKFVNPLSTVMPEPKEGLSGTKNNWGNFK